MEKDAQKRKGKLEDNIKDTGNLSYELVSHINEPSDVWMPFTFRHLY